jgi:tRNA-dihydrouridine synthase
MKYNDERYGLLLMRKHYGGYFRGLPDFKQFRLPLVTAASYEDILLILQKVADYYENIGM